MNASTKFLGMKFSIIVPVFNAAKYLEESIGTLLSQSFMDWECICVDDGSTDGSGPILDHFTERDTRFKVLHIKNSGVGMARNKALENANGEWILFMDADDGFAHNALKVLSESVCECSADMVLFDFRSVNQIGTTSSKAGDVKFFDMTDDQSAISAYRETALLFVWNACYRRCLISELRFKNLTIGEDSVFGFEAFAKARVFGRLHSQIYEYRYRSDSAIHSDTMQHVLSCIDSYAALTAILKSWRYYEQVKKLSHKRFLSGYCGQTYSRILSLNKRERVIAQQHFFEVGRRIVRQGTLADAILRSDLRMLFMLTLYAQYKIKVFLMRGCIGKMLRRIQYKAA